MNNHDIGRYLEDFYPGMLIEHATSKTIFESDNNLFSLLTMNHHPVHTNMDYAGKQWHGQILVVGTLVFSLIVGMTVNDISGKAIANLEYEKVEHLKPTFLNDTLYARSKIIDVRPSKNKPDRGIVYVETASSPYLASKAAADLLVMAYYRTYQIPVTISRCSNNYGPYQFPEKLIPLMIANALEAKMLPVYGTGENVRDWLYVEDHCRAIDKIIHNGKEGEIFNIGGTMNERTWKL